MLFKYRENKANQSTTNIFYNYSTGNIAENSEN